jgi:hypothetical protein
VDEGLPGREIFSIKAPPCKAFRGDHGLPYAVDKEPYLTVAARQHGAAWEASFVAIFEPTVGADGSSLTSIESFEAEGAPAGFVGLVVKSRSGRVDHIFSSDREQNVSYGGMKANAAYAIVAENGRDFTLFMGSGRSLQAKGFAITADEKSCAVLEYKNGKYYFTCDAPVVIRTANGREIEMDKTSYQTIAL